MILQKQTVGNVAVLESLRSRFEHSIQIHWSVKFFCKVANQPRTAKNSSREKKFREIYGKIESRLDAF